MLRRSSTDSIGRAVEQQPAAAPQSRAVDITRSEEAQTRFNAIENAKNNAKWDTIAAIYAAASALVAELLALQSFDYTTIARFLNDRGMGKSASEALQITGITITSLAALFFARKMKNRVHAHPISQDALAGVTALSGAEERRLGIETARGQISYRVTTPPQLFHRLPHVLSALLFFAPMTAMAFVHGKNALKENDAAIGLGIIMLLFAILSGTATLMSLAYATRPVENTNAVENRRAPLLHPALKKPILDAAIMALATSGTALSFGNFNALVEWLCSDPHYSRTGAQLNVGIIGAGFAILFISSANILKREISRCPIGPEELSHFIPSPDRYLWLSMITAFMLGLFAMYEGQEAIINSKTSTASTTAIAASLFFVSTLFYAIGYMTTGIKLFYTDPVLRRTEESSTSLLTRFRNWMGRNRGEEYQRLLADNAQPTYTGRTSNLSDRTLDTVRGDGRESPAI